MENKRIAVAMSGGVDSSVAAYLLKNQGLDPLGISMQVWDYRNNGGSCTRATCCSPDDFTDARRVAGRINIPYYVFDFEKTFEREVISKFVRTYESGQTPNPCVDCNSKVKFLELRNRAKALGCSAVATGHYAQVKHTDTGSHLLRGVDSDKDQSYFLYGLKQSELAQTLFPVGHLTKPEVREIAKEAGLPTASKPESQDICFVSGTVAEFMKRRGVPARKGNILNKRGEILAQHDGIHTYTVGQRRGLGVGGSEQPLYVTEIDSATNSVVVGPAEELERDCYIVSQVNWINPTLSKEGLKTGINCIAQMRHRHKGVPVKIEPIDNSTVRVIFTGEFATVSPGQAAVFYDESNTEVLGGGKIGL